MNYRPVIPTSYLEVNKCNRLINSIDYVMCSFTGLIAFRVVRLHSCPKQQSNFYHYSRL